MMGRIVFVVAVLTLGARAADWGSWRGPNRDGHTPAGEAVPEKLPAQPKVLWHIPTADGYASPVVAEGKVALLDFAPGKELKDGKEIVRLLNAADGQELWKVPLDSPHKDGFGTGPRCTPLIVGDKVYAQSTKGELKCLALADGKEIWHTNYIKDFGQVFIGEKGDAAGSCRHGNAGSPLVDGNRLYALVSGPGAAVVCFNKDDGKVIWKSQDDTCAYAPPVMLTLGGVRQLVVFTTTALIGLNPDDGALFWRVPLKTRLGRHVTAPVAVGDTVMVASHQLGLVGVKVSHDGSAWKAEQAWQTKEAQINFSSPVCADGHLYGLGSASKIVCADPATGAILWDQNGVIQTDQAKAYCAFIVMGKNILTLTDTGDAVLFAVDGKEYKELGKAKVCEKNWCNPAYADGRLYVRDKTELRCVELIAK